MRKYMALCLLLCVAFLAACQSSSPALNESKRVSAQQGQYGMSQPIPVFNWSFERHLDIELYKLRNRNIATHSVWRSDYGMVEGDCPSIGYGLPYDTSLTNPLVTTDLDQNGLHSRGTPAVIEQPEPNGIFASKNTSATWVLCVDGSGGLTPVYVESHVTAYPWPVHVDYGLDRVTRAGESSVRISTGRHAPTALK